jgi:hypothetical protein
MLRRIRENNKRAIESVILAMAGIVLCLLIGVVFTKETTDKASVMSEEECRLVSILEMIDGVGETQVMIGTSEDGEKRVVVVCEGADSISVMMDVREAAANALGIDEKLVKIYLKNK